MHKYGYLVFFSSITEELTLNFNICDGKPRESCEFKNFTLSSLVRTTSMDLYSNLSKSFCLYTIPIKSFILYTIFS